jgi:hypothetical protein
MFKRKGRGYYTRRRVAGKDRWIALGKDYEEACRKFRETTGRQVPEVRLSVAEAAQRWLDTYVANHRAEQQRGMAAQRVRDYLSPFMGYKLLSSHEERPARVSTVAGGAR